MNKKVFAFGFLYPLISMVLLVPITPTENLELRYCMLDLNGTISQNGQIIEGIKPLIHELQTYLQFFLLSADTRGTAQSIASELGVQLIPLASIPLPPQFMEKILPLPPYLKSSTFGKEAMQKAALIFIKGPSQCVALGNGQNDVLMLLLAQVGIGILGREGLARDCLLTADILVSSPVDALNLLVHPLNLRATLRS